MKTICIAFFALLISQVTHAQSLQYDGPTCDLIAPAVQPYIEQGLFQGNLLIAQRGKVLCQQHIGLANQKLGEPMSRHSRFPIASLSKPIVATLLLKLQEKGLLDLQATIDEYLPEFNAPWVSQVSLHHLLANRSGLPNHFMLAGWRTGRYQKTVAERELLDEIAKLDLAFTSGTQYQYSNLGWHLLAEVLESVTKKGLEANLLEHIFTPLLMSQTGTVYQADIPLVTGYRWGSRGGWQQQENLHMQVFNAGGGLYSTAEDLLRYLTALHRGSVLSKQSMTQMFAPQTPYGWTLRSVTLASALEKNVHSYNGQLEGHSSFVYQVLEDDVSLILLTNNGLGYEHKRALANDILSAFYNVSYPKRKEASSFILNRGLLDNQWVSTIQLLSHSQITDIQEARLVNDLAQQLDWSGNTEKAIDLYYWLASSFPENNELKQQLKRSCAKQKDYAACTVSKKYNVGMALLPLIDQARNAWRSDEHRPVTTHVFYPTLDPNIEALMLGPKTAPFFHSGTVAKGAKPIEGKRPLVIMSHGTGGSALQMLWLAEALVKQGYLVAAINHHGNTAHEKKKFPEGYLLWWERTLDLHVAYQQLLTDPVWEGLIDADKVAVVGFSLGGYTALSALGGITDKTLFDKYCEQAFDDFSCQPQPEFSKVLEAFEQVKNTSQVADINARQNNNYQLPALKAAVVIAPALVHAFRSNSLTSIKTPTLLMVGSKDNIAPAEPNAEYAHMLIPTSQLSIIPDAHHYSFLSNCTQHGKQTLTQLCDSPFGVDRREVHQLAIEQTLMFLEEHL